MKEEMIARIEGAKRNLGPLKIQILSAIFESQKSVSEGVGAKRFRADHKEWIREIEDIESKHTLIRRTNDERDVYYVTPYSLPLLESNKAERIIEVMEVALSKLQEFYSSRLNERVEIEELLGIDGIDDEDLRHALYFLSETHGVFSSTSADFPYAKASSCHLYEGVIRVESSLDILCQYYDQLDDSKSVMMPQDLLYANLNDGLQESPSIISSFFRGEERVHCLDFLDEGERRIMIEVEKALKSGLVALSAMGIRTLFDFYLQKQLPNYQNFSAGIKELRKQGHFSSLDEDLIKTVVDLGNAAAHRGHIPSSEDLEVCIQVYARLVVGDRDLRSRVSDLAKKIPQRENKKKVGNE